MSLINGIFRELYWPICRAYSRHLGDRPADGLLRCLCSLQFLRVQGFWPNFVHPHRFSEKSWSSMLHKRDPLLTLISDKLRVRDFVAEKAGSEYLIQLLWSGDKPEEIPFDELPAKFVIKANHGCQYNIIVTDKNKLNRANTILQLKKWLGKNFGQDTFLGIAWAYKNIKPAIVIESFIEENGKSPTDYKFWCFSGRVECVILYLDRSETLSAKALNRNFEPIELRFNVREYQGKCQRPVNFDKMIQVAESLAKGFDFVRVDLYNLQGRILFGELTLYHGGVTYQFLPASQDYFFGEKWKRVI